MMAATSQGHESETLPRVMFPTGAPVVAAGAPSSPVAICSTMGPL